MAIETTVIGGYPKPPPEGGTFTVRKTLHALERGDASVDDLVKAQNELAAEVIAEQEAAGIDLVTDGLVRWDDIVTPFARAITGFEIGGLIRWFDNNVYYRRPICTGPVEWGTSASVDAFKFATSVATKPVKAVIPGPVSFARLSIDEHYSDHKSFVQALAPVLAQEAFELRAAGAKHIQIDEPALLDAPEDMDLAAEAIHVIAHELDDVELTVATYFGDAKRLGPQIFELPVDVIGLDLIAGPENLELIKSLPSERKLQAGIVDGRNTKLEDEDALVRAIEGIAANVGPDCLRLAPSCSLEFLPREKAKAKLERLVQAAGKVAQR